MKSAAVLLSVDSDCWRVALAGETEVKVHELDAADVEGPLEIARELASILDDWGCKRKEICLGLPSDIVLAVRFDSANLPRKQRREAMIYRLEEHIPIDAEQLTADFLPPVGGNILGMAVETVLVRTIVDSLLEVGIETVAVCPTALLGLWDCLGRSNAESGDYVIVTNPQCVDVFRIIERQPSAWYTSSGEPSEIIRCLQADMLADPIEAEHPTALLVGSLDDQVELRVKQETSLEIISIGEESAIVAAARTADAILGGQTAGWVNFRRDDLAMQNTWGRFAGLIKTAVILASLLPVVLAAMFYWRGTCYNAITQNYEQEQIAEFQDIYRNQEVPTGIRSRFESELKNIAGKSGAGVELPAQPCALETLRRITTNLPPAVRLRIVEARIDITGILIEGQTRNHSGAEIISHTLAKSGFVMAQPRTEHLVRGGVAFTLVGKLSEGKQLTKTEGNQP